MALWTQCGTDKRCACPKIMSLIWAKCHNTPDIWPRLGEPVLKLKCPDSA